MGAHIVLECPNIATALLQTFSGEDVSYNLANIYQQKFVTSRPIIHFFKIRTCLFSRPILKVYLKQFWREKYFPVCNCVTALTISIVDLISPIKLEVHLECLIGRSESFAVTHRIGINQTRLVQIFIESYQVSHETQCDPIYFPATFEKRILKSAPDIDLPTAIRKQLRVWIWIPIGGSRIWEQRRKSKVRSCNPVNAKRQYY